MEMNMKHNRTLIRTIKILELLASSKQPLTLSEIIEELKIPKSSTYDILSTLVYTNSIEIADINRKSYSIGPKSFHIGISYVSNQDIFQVAKPYLAHIADKLEKTAFLGTLYDNKVLYVLKHESDKSIITTSKVGNSNYIHCTSLGKSLYAFSDKSKIDISKMDFVKKTNHTITSKESFLEEIEKVKKNGYSLDNREYEEHMLCIGAPIYDHNANVNYAISIAGMYNDEVDIDVEAKIVMNAAKDISKKLGYIID